MTRRVAILGLGERGSAFARAFHASGWSVAGFDPDASAGSEIAFRSDWRRYGTISQTVATADWIVLCLPERIELLRKVIQRAQAEAPEGAILAIATRDTDAEAVQGCAMRPGQVLRLAIDPSGGLFVDATRANSVECRSEATKTLATLLVTDALLVRATNFNADQSPEAESA